MEIFVGNQGGIDLGRHTPEPVLLSAGAFDLTTSSIWLRSTEYWTGDRVWIAARDGLMFSETEQLPTLHTSSFAAVYVHLDAANRISFYATEEASLLGLAVDRLQFQLLPLYRVLMAGYIDSTYGFDVHDAAWEAANLVPPEPDYEDILTDVVPNSPAIRDYVDPRLNQQWGSLNGLTSWTFKTGASTEDTTAIGEEFGEYEKIVVRGSGDLTIQLRYDAGSREIPVEAMLRLTQVLSKNSLIPARLIVASDSRGLVLLYDPLILITDTSWSRTPDSLVECSVNFVTCQEYRLRIDRNAAV
jgi:hypothetical protein